MGARKISLSVKSLPCRCEDPNLDPWNPCKKQGMVVGTIFQGMVR